MCKNHCVNACSSWRLWIKPILILLYTLFLICVVPWLIFETIKDGFTREDQLIWLGGLFVILAIPLCIWHIVQHMLHFTKPILQKPIIRILWMVPIYAVNAWVGLIFPEHSFYMNSLRECYEGYVIYNFMSYLLNFLNLEMDLEAALEYKPPVNHVFPLCCMEPWPPGRSFVHNCKHGVLQYVVIRPILTFISIIAEWNGVYGEGIFAQDVAYPYVVAINNISQFSAMYCLVLFYQANKEELRPMKPLPKFLCIKAVVFFTFVQSVVIGWLVYMKYINNMFGSESDNLSVKLQNFIICIEMFIAALAHKYSFPHEPYHINIPDYGNDRTWFNSLSQMWDMSDVRHDVTEHLGVVGSSLSRRLRGRTEYHYTRGSERSHLMSNGVNITTNSSGKLIWSQKSLQPNLQPSAQIITANLQPGHSYNFNSASDSEGSTKYGALNSSGDDIAPVHIKHDVININKKKNSTDYSPQYGVPKVLGNYLQQSRSNQNATSNRSDNTTSRSESGFDLLAFEKTDTETEPSSAGAIKKSDSNASDWLSTPTDDFMGIDLRSIDKDRSHFKRDPKI